MSLNALSNIAAWQTAAKVKSFEVKEAPTYAPGQGEILVRNKAVSINHIECIIQAPTAFLVDYPTILGHDAAGDVVAVCPNVSRFKPGDRVAGQAVGITTKRIQDNAFQLYPILTTYMASEILPNIFYERAAVIPLALSTAACGLFQVAPLLNLQLPTIPARELTGKALLIWGGSTSVGSNAIQLATAAGYKVIATQDNSSTIEHDLTTTFMAKGKHLSGALACVGDPATTICAHVVHIVADTGRAAATKSSFKDPPDGITIKHIFGSTLKDNFVGEAIYEDFLSKALKKWLFCTSTRPRDCGPRPGQRAEGCRYAQDGRVCR